LPTSSAITAGVRPWANREALFLREDQRSLVPLIGGRVVGGFAGDFGIGTDRPG
jgi:hypothetical protein